MVRQLICWSPIQLAIRVDTNVGLPGIHNQEFPHLHHHDQHCRGTGIIGMGVCLSGVAFGLVVN